MATLFFRLFMAPSGAAAEKLENHLSSLSFIIIITVVIVWWPKACAFIRYFVSFFSGMFFGNQRARQPLITQGGAVQQSDDICDTLSFY